MSSVTPLRIAVLLAVQAGGAAADPAVIENVVAQSGANGWRFDVTLSHGDTGWSDYADGWRVVGEDGTVFGTRELLHPHEHEQPFTRALTGVSIPAQVTRVHIEARTKPDGWGDVRFPVDLAD